MLGGKYGKERRLGQEKGAGGLNKDIVAIFPLYKFSGLFDVK
jgi:hypothetical protein